MVEDRTVKEAMTRAYVGVSESDTVGDVVDLMLDDGVASVVVVRGAEPVGTATERDLLRAAATGSLPVEADIASVMSGPGPRIDEETPLSEAASTLSTADERQLLVTNGDGLTGVLTARDVIAAAASMFSSPDPESDSGPEPDTTPMARDEADETATYTTQSVCETCGTLMPGLESVDGRAICGDCRSI